LTQGQLVKGDVVEKRLKTTGPSQDQSHQNLFSNKKFSSALYMMKARASICGLASCCWNQNCFPSQSRLSHERWRSILSSLKRLHGVMTNVALFRCSKLRTLHAA